MGKIKSKQICENIIQVHIDRMHELCDNRKVSDAESVYSEIKEWVIQKENLEILCLDYINSYFED
jgi:hypothetical protein